MSPDRPLTAPVAVNRTYLEQAGEGRELSGLEITAKLAAVLEVEPAELLKR